MKKNKREEMLKASLKVAVDRGYRNIRISDITECAGVGKGTFYNYFSNLNDCFRQASEMVTFDLRNKYITSGKVKSIDDIPAVAAIVFDGTWKNRVLGRLYAYEMLEVDKDFNRTFTSFNKNIYKDIVKIVRPQDSEEVCEVKALSIMGIIDAIILEVFMCDNEDENIAKKRFISAFSAIINADFPIT